MHQPIRWHEWGEEAFAAAQRDNKPMLLDIGAVWCHWCHVMDRESYDDPEVAQIVNDNFIAVKVDRDERPDIDSRYQAAVSAISGQGGWPLTAFLTPDGKPFYGGTYFPPQDLYGRPSFKRVLTSIANAYREKHADVAEQSKLVEQAISQAESFTGRSGRFSAHAIDAIVKSAMTMFDSANGGFGQAPKFPHPGALDLLIERYARTGDDELRNVFVTTLTCMANGGVYDQLAGGFHRYSVDERWVVPHFEKMCYDNSELLKNYVHAYQVTGTEFFAERGARHHPLDGRVAQRPRARRLLCFPGCRLFHGRRRRLLHLDGGGNQGSPHNGRSTGCPAPLRHQRSRRDAPQSRQECVVPACLDRRNRQAT